MLASMRTTANSVFMKLLMGLLVISFAVWGVGDVVRSGGNGKLITVGDDSVSYQEYARSVSSMERSLEAMGMRDVPRAAVEKQVMQQLVEQKIVEQRMKDAGLEVNDTLLAQRIAKLPMFHDVRGKFDPKLFEATLAQRQMSEPMLLKELATDIRAETFSTSLDTDGLTPPPALAALQETAKNERRDAVLFTLPASAVKVEPLDEAALKDYYETNKALLYMAPERRTLEYVTFSAADMQKLAQKEVTPEAIADRMASDPEHYTDEKMAREELQTEAMEGVADRISIAIEDALAAGDTMGEAVAASGLSASSRVLRDVTAEQYANGKDAQLATVAEKGFTMMEGETSGIETTASGGYYMVTVQEIVEAEPKPYETVAADVAKRANARAQNKALRERGNALADALKDATEWQPVAREFGATTRPVNNLLRGDAKAVPAALNEAVFEREVGEVAGPLIEDSRAQLALVTDARVPAPQKPDAKQVAAMGTDLQRDLLGSYYTDLLRSYPVSVNEAMMQQIRAQDGGA